MKPKIKPQTSNTSAARLSQKSLLGLGIKRKNGEVKPSANDNSKQSKPNNSEEKTTTTASTTATTNTANQPKDIKDLPCIETNQFDKGNFKCVAILPGLGPYNESSDSEISSDSEDEPHGCEDHNKYDLVGRKHQKKKHDHHDD